MHNLVQRRLFRTTPRVESCRGRDHRHRCASAGPKGRPRSSSRFSPRAMARTISDWPRPAVRLPRPAVRPLVREIPLGDHASSAPAEGAPSGSSDVAARPADSSLLVDATKAPNLDLFDPKGGGVDAAQAISVAKIAEAAAASRVISNVPRCMAKTESASRVRPKASSTTTEPLQPPSRLWSHPRANAPVTRANCRTVPPELPLQLRGVTPTCTVTELRTSPRSVARASSASTLRLRSHRIHTRIATSARTWLSAFHEPHAVARAIFFSTVIFGSLRLVVARQDERVTGLPERPSREAPRPPGPAGVRRCACSR